MCGSSSKRQADVEQTPISEIKLWGTGHQINYIPHRAPVLEAREQFRAPSVSQRLALPQSWRPSEVSLKSTSGGLHHVIGQIRGESKLDVFGDSQGPFLSAWQFWGLPSNSTDCFVRYHDRGCPLEDTIYITYGTLVDRLEYFNNWSRY